MQPFSSDHITLGKICVVVVLSLAVFLIIFYVTPENKWLYQRANQCYYKCESDQCNRLMKQTRGSTYIIDNNGWGSDYEGCAFGFWEASHFVFHIFIGYFLNLQASLAIGVGFELFEAATWGCESYFDIAYNTAGALVGIALREHFVARAKKEVGTTN